MKIRCIDFETTGKIEEREKGKPVGICEFGFADVDGSTGAVSKPVSSLINCGIAMPPEARAIHHISDEDVSESPTPDFAFKSLMDGMEPGDVFCAHNAAFEQAIFTGSTFPWICTMQSAKHLWEDAPGYSNQTLRYWLGVDADFEWPPLAMPPHRAGPDAYVTAHILSRMVKDKHPSVLIQLTNTPVLLKTVGFTKDHYGKLWSDMDRGFLEWCVDPRRDNLSPEIRHTARHWLNKLTMSGTPFA
ncbi:hypothetical protein F9K91_07990 [Brucella tritici]|uniref:Exonuclease domain-containing protein n=2 Tax=Brucella/Ochrobactrum group TaxID=2826938 RepID=A0A833CQH1_9HYPH|nr:MULTISPECIES: exonuclease domain-containing protein [Brucella]KAB2666062.1 hypothetical protein F9K91_07990 [Brucella tritici]KAB2699391.1 hypothetical protein F9K79_09870 [Ochrobactrum sp. Kaboul]SPL65413.1 Exodeoxyribonuclease X [[Ochrobactrum] soli]